jgi:hypothetical protein
MLRKRKSITRIHDLQPEEVVQLAQVLDSKRRAQGHNEIV